MSKRKWPVGSFVPCSPRHLHCSPAHAELVRGYREERERQETANEYLHANGERKFWKANGGKMIDFKMWLKSHKGSKLSGSVLPWTIEPKCVGKLTPIERINARDYAAMRRYG